MIEGEYTLQQKYSDEQIIRGKHIINQIFKVQFLLKDAFIDQIINNVQLT